MANQDLSLVRFCVFNYFSILISSYPFQPNITKLTKIVESLISSEKELDKEMINYKKRVEWIYQNTHKEVNEHLSIIELAVFRNLNGRLNREIDIGDKTFSITELYKYLDEVSKELTDIVICIAKKYSVDIPMNFFNNPAQNKISFE